jgi:CubicO group peptidase (beta-lactamase class C family)
MLVQESKLNQVLEKTIDNKNIFGIVVNIETVDNNFSWINSVGNLDKYSQYAIGSISKMYTTASILRLVSEEKLALQDKISKYLPMDIICNLHVYKGIEYSNDITIEHLLSHTSGLPDYYEEKGEDGRSVVTNIIVGDQFFSINDIISSTKKLKPHFKPGDKGKAFYSDVNFDILGVIIEKVTNKKLKDVFSEYIFKPLALTNTYLYDVCSNNKFSPIYYKSKPLNRPFAISSFSASGGIVSNVEENMKFLKAFFNGDLFPKKYLKNSYNWNRIQWFPLEYGLGLMRCKMSRIMSPIIPAPEIIGHSGSTGTFAFYYPGKNLFIAGAFNQMIKQPFPLIYRLINCF